MILKGLMRLSKLEDFSLSVLLDTVEGVWLEVSES